MMDARCFLADVIICSRGGWQFDEDGMGPAACAYNAFRTHYTLWASALKRRGFNFEPRVHYKSSSTETNNNDETRPARIIFASFSSQRPTIYIRVRYLFN
jgi:hypothetical protein